jgi:DNA polymerase
MHRSSGVSEKPQPGARTIAQLRLEVHDCHACDLWLRASQAVFGEGPEGAKVMLVGEQPGDAEDREGLRRIRL